MSENQNNIINFTTGKPKIINSKITIMGAITGGDETVKIGVDFLIQTQNLTGDDEITPDVLQNLEWGVSFSESLGGEKNLKPEALPQKFATNAFAFPLDFKVNREKLSTCIKELTGGWNNPTIWYQTLDLDLSLWLMNDPSNIEIVVMPKGNLIMDTSAQ